MLVWKPWKVWQRNETAYAVRRSWYEYGDSGLGDSSTQTRQIRADLSDLTYEDVHGWNCGRWEYMGKGHEDEESGCPLGDFYMGQRMEDRMGHWGEAVLRGEWYPNAACGEPIWVSEWP